MPELMNFSGLVVLVEGRVITEILAQIFVIIKIALEL